MVSPPAAPQVATGEIAVELVGITKRFPGVVANDNIHLTVRRGTVHAIVGENGAGKSTLMKILYGMQQPDEGTISIDGSAAAMHSPLDAIERGVGMVHQHFMLADNFTVLENVILGGEPTKGAGSTSARLGDRINEISDSYGLDVDPDALVERLGVGDRQRVEILKVLYRGARTLILDEPTAVLVPQEVDELFDNLRELKSEGLTVIFISHKLDEVLSVADEITVDPPRHDVATVDPKPGHGAGARRADGGQRAAHRPRRESPPSPTSRCSRIDGLTLANLEGRLLLDDVDVPHPQGRGARHRRGRGQRPGRARRGDHGHPRDSRRGRSPSTATTSPQASTRERREAGVGYIPEDRHRHGCCSSRRCGRTACSGTRPSAPNVKGPWIDRAGARKDTERIVDGLRRPHARHRRARLRAVRRQPAEAHRRPRDERRPKRADRRPPDAGRGRRRPGGDLGPHPRGPPDGPRGAADLGRPRRAHRAVRLDQGDAARAARGRRWTRRRDARATRLGDDRSG